MHCFEYGRKHQEELKKYCEEVIYYKRKSGLKYFFSSLPYIVITRNSAKLIANLLKDNHPILFEGLHSTYYLNDEGLKGRKLFVRMHNIEYDYYNRLSQSEKKIVQKIYLKQEAKKLKKYESVISKATAILAISESDRINLIKKYSNTILLPAFHAYENINSSTGVGKYALYHGNLSVAENNDAALFLVNQVFNDLKIPLIISGSNPSEELKREIQKHDNIQLKENVSTIEIEDLIKNAQVNVLPTFQPTGIKLKLLSALYNGRFCIVNPEMVENKGLEQLCIISKDATSWKKNIVDVFSKEFTSTEIEKRNKILKSSFDNLSNAEKLIRQLGIS